MIITIQPGDMTRYTAVIDKNFLAIGAGDAVRGGYVPPYWEYDDGELLVQQYTSHHYVSYFAEKYEVDYHTAFVGVLFYCLMCKLELDSALKNMPELLKEARYGFERRSY